MRYQWWVTTYYSPQSWEELVSVVSVYHRERLQKPLDHLCLWYQMCSRMEVEHPSFIESTSPILGCLKVGVNEMLSPSPSNKLARNVVTSRGRLLDWIEFWVSRTQPLLKTLFCPSLPSKCLGLIGWWVSPLKWTMAILSFAWVLSWTKFFLPIAFARLSVPKTLRGNHLILVGPLPYVVKETSKCSIIFPLDSRIVWSHAI